VKKRSRRGVVLVTVLWSIVLLSTLAMATSLTFRGFAGIMAVSRDRLKAEGLLTAGLEVAAGMVASAGQTPLYDVESNVALSSGRVAIRLDDEGGRVDVGRAPADLLAALFRSIEVPDAEAIAQRIVEWRKPDTAAAPAKPAAPANPNLQPEDDAENDVDDDPGAANAGNAANPAASGTKPAPSTQSILTSVAQLLEVPGMRPEWVNAIAPLVTVFGNDTVNPVSAPPAVLALIPGIDRQNLAPFLAARREPMDPKQLAGMLGATQVHIAVKPQQAISVRLRAALPDGYTAEATAVIVCLKGDREPYRILAWTPVVAPLRP
jgi:general secretion pathway protein K